MADLRFHATPVDGRLVVEVTGIDGDDHPVAWNLDPARLRDDLRSQSDWAGRVADLNHLSEAMERAGVSERQRAEYLRLMIPPDLKTRVRPAGPRRRADGSPR